MFAEVNHGPDDLGGERARLSSQGYAAAEHKKGFAESDRPPVRPEKTCDNKRTASLPSTADLLTSVEDRRSVPNADLPGAYPTAPQLARIQTKSEKWRSLRVMSRYEERSVCAIFYR